MAVLQCLYEFQRQNVRHFNGSFAVLMCEFQRQNVRHFNGSVAVLMCEFQLAECEAF
jgi:hypothetical protein